MKLQDDIYEMIEEEDVKFIRLQFTDVFGNLKNIAVTSGQMEKVLQKRFPIDSSVMFDGLYDPQKNLYLYPDLSTFVILPWRPQHGKVGKFICDVCYKDGTPFEMSPRTILKNVVHQVEKEGYAVMIDPECEFFLFHTDENGAPTTISHEKAGYLDVGPLDLGENARRDMVLTLEEMGFEIESSHHEKAPAQHEIDFAQGGLLDTADSLMTFKFAIRSIAKRFGLYATFMPKPKKEVAGSGMHLNISLYKEGKNIFCGKEGEIASESAKQFMGGVIEHVQGICAITNPVVNSYKRLLSGFNAPGKINWSTTSETTLIKCHDLSDETKVELRFPDSSANPYLALAVCLMAGLDGMKKKSVLGKENENSTKSLPGNLKDAIEIFEKDQLLKEVLGEDLLKIYVDIKNKEWNDYMMQVSDWEVERYLTKM